MKCVQALSEITKIYKSEYISSASSVGKKNKTKQNMKEMNILYALDEKRYFSVSEWWYNSTNVDFVMNQG